MALTKVTKELIQGGLGIDWQSTIKTGNFQSVASQGYFVNTTSNEVTITMPPSPVVGDIVEIVDYAGTAQTNNIKITAQANINGSANDVKIDYQRGAVSIIYSGTAQGWLAEFAANDGTNALVNSPPAISIQWLVVAGGGGGGSEYGGGGGAGGLRTSYGSTSPITISGGTMESAFQALQATPYDITVGGGGLGSVSASGSGPGSNGGNSILATITSTGGGGGGNNSGSNGGSGGGAGCSGGTGVIGNAVTSPVVQGFNGGNRGSYSPKYPTGGGGGAKEVGYSAPDQNTSGAGGDGLEINILGGTGNFYAGGGGGGGQNSVTAGSGGSSIGGDGTGNTIGGTAVVNTGSGGGGAGSNTGRAGGGGSSGIVILRYPTADVTSYSTTGTLNTTSTTTFPVTNNGLYTFNGNALDTTGNGYNGTVRGITYTTGKFSTAATFAGGTDTNASTGSQIYISNSVWGATKHTFSVSLWFKGSTSPGEIPLIGNGGTIGGQTGFMVYTTANGNLNGTFMTNGSAIYFGNTTNISNNQWHHVALTMNNGPYVLYLDGAVHASGNSSYYINNPTPTYDTFVGNRFNRNENGVLNGQIDQLRIFNSVLSSANITSLYNEGYVRETTDGTDSILEFLGGTGNITFS